MAYRAWQETDSRAYGEGGAISSSGTRACASPSHNLIGSNLNWHALTSIWSTRFSQQQLDPSVFAVYPLNGRFCLSGECEMQYNIR